MANNGPGLTRPSWCAGRGANITYNSQSTFVLPLEFQDGTVLHIYMGDRWNFYGSGKVPRMHTPRHMCGVARPGQGLCQAVFRTFHEC